MRKFKFCIYYHVTVACEQRMAWTTRIRRANCTGAGQRAARLIARGPVAEVQGLGPWEQLQSPTQQEQEARPRRGRWSPGLCPLASRYLFLADDLVRLQL